MARGMLGLTAVVVLVGIFVVLLSDRLDVRWRSGGSATASQPGVVVATGSAVQGSGLPQGPASGPFGGQLVVPNGELAAGPANSAQAEASRSAAPAAANQAGVAGAISAPLPPELS